MRSAALFGLLLSCSGDGPPAASNAVPASSATASSISPAVAPVLAAPTSSAASSASAPAGRIGIVDNVFGPFLPTPIVGDVPPLGPLDRKTLPSSKYRLLMTVDDALVKGDATALGGMMVDTASLKAVCAGKSDHDRQLLTAVDELREMGARTFAECAAFADWKRAKRLLLEDKGEVARQLDSSVAAGSHARRRRWFTR